MKNWISKGKFVLKKKPNKPYLTNTYGGKNIFKEGVD